MASTDHTSKIEFGPFGPSGRTTIKSGIATLSSGTVDVDVGLNTVNSFVCSPVSESVATEHLVLSCSEDFPYTTLPNAITVKGMIVDDNETTLADVLIPAVAQQFSWIAIGE